MRLLFFILIISLFKADYSNAQNREINKIELSNSILKNQIEDFIKLRKKEHLKFVEIGYVIVRLDFFNSNAKNEELSYTYTIRDQYVSLKDNSHFPLLYTFIENKIVLMFVENFKNNVKASAKAKRRLAKKVNKSLGKRERIIAYNSDGKKIISDNNFYPNESFNIHGGIRLNVFANDSISIKKL